MPFKPNERQYRNFIMEVEIPDDKRIDTEYYIEGYAMKYSPYLLYEDSEGPVYEEFRREAFEQTDVSDVIFQYNHEGRVFARNSNGSLLLWFDEIGLRIAADLGLTTASRELYEEIESGLTTKMSWAFRVGDVDYNKQSRTIVHNSVPKIFDVSAVSIPANGDTEIYARKFGNGVISQIEEEFLKRERAKKKLKLMIEMEGFLNEDLRTN